MKRGHRRGLTGTIEREMPRLRNIPISSSALPAHTHSGALDGGSLTVGAGGAVTTDTDGTPDNVWFFGASGGLQEDATILRVDSTNRGVIAGEGDSSYTSKGSTKRVMLTVERVNSSVWRGMRTHASGNTSSITPQNVFTRSRGSLVSQTACISGNIIGQFVWEAHDGTDYNPCASFQADIDGAVSANTVPTALIFKTTTTNSLTERLRIAPNGEVIVNNTGASTGDFRAESNNQTHMLFVDAGAESVGIRSSAPGASAAGLHVPWVNGDADTTAYFGSANGLNDRVAIEARSNSGHGILATSASAVGVWGVSGASFGIHGYTDTGVGVRADGVLSGGVALEAYGTVAGTTIAKFGNGAANTLITFEYTGDILLADGLSIKTAAGPVVTFDDTGDDLEITGCDVLIDPGAGLAAPDGTLHVHTATAGAVVAVAEANDLVVENSTHGGISILTPATDIGSIIFGCPGANTSGGLSYFHALDLLTLVAGGTALFAVDSTSIYADGPIVMSDNTWIGLGAAKGRIEFDDQATDEINFIDCNVGIGKSDPGDLLTLLGGSLVMRETDDGNDAVEIFAGATSGVIRAMAGGATTIQFGGAGLSHINTGYGLAVGAAAASAKLHVDQNDSGAGTPAIAVDQADISEGFIDFIAASAASVANPISTWTTGNSIQGFVRVEINGAYQWIPYYDAPTS